MTVTALRPYTTAELDIATIGQLGTYVMALKEIPAEALAELCVDNAMAYLTLYGAHKAIEEKLLQMSARFRE